MNYGVGGNYEAHYDHATPPNTYNIFQPYAWGKLFHLLIDMKYNHLILKLALGLTSLHDFIKHESIRFPIA